MGIPHMKPQVNNRQILRKLKRKAKKESKNTYFRQKSKQTSIKEIVKPKIVKKENSSDSEDAMDGFSSDTTVDTIIDTMGDTIVDRPVDEDNYYADKLKIKNKDQFDWEDMEEFRDILTTRQDTDDSSDTSDTGDISEEIVWPDESQKSESTESDEVEVTFIPEQEPTLSISKDNPISSDQMKSITRWINRLSLKTFIQVSTEISLIISLVGTQPIAVHFVDILSKCTIEGVMWFNCALISHIAFKDSKGPLFITQLLLCLVDQLPLNKLLFQACCVLVHCKVIPVGFIVSILTDFVNLNQLSISLEYSSLAVELLGEKLRKECKTEIKLVCDQLRGKEEGPRNEFLFSKFESLLHSKFESRKYERIPSVWSDLKLYFKSNTLLSISVQDLKNCKSNGMWWINGTSFAGHSKELISARVKQLEQVNKQSQMAQLMGMNTDIRKSLFLVILNAQDYRDASDQLLHYKLQKNQEREIINVLFQMIKTLKKENKFYFLVLQQLCIKRPSLEYSCRKRIYQMLEEELNPLETQNCLSIIVFCISHKIIQFSSIVKAIDFESHFTFLKSLITMLSDKYLLKPALKDLEIGLKLKLETHNLLQVNNLL